MRSGKGACQIMVIKLKIKEMHFKNVNVDHWVHALYMKILNMFIVCVCVCTVCVLWFYTS